MMIKNALLVILVVLAGCCIFIATRPSSFHIERSTVVQAPATAIYPQVADFHRWADWSPWEKLDPGMTKSFDGPDAGPGAIYQWAGNSTVGEGRMTITNVQANEWVAIKLEFLKPFKAINDTKFTFVPQGQATRVTWTMDGKN